MASQLHISEVTSDSVCGLTTGEDLKAQCKVLVTDFVGDLPVLGFWWG